MKQVVVIRTGVANIASVLAAIKRAGAAPILSEDPAAVLAAEYAVLPGVGAFAAGAQSLRERELDAAIRQRLEHNRPLLAVCLGLQLLFDASDESPGVAGLGIFPGTIRKIPGAPKLPQLGWNEIEAAPGSCFLESAAVYFANSYCVVVPPAAVKPAMVNYGGTFVAGFERGTLLACQFHPELSGEAGQRMLKRWIDQEIREQPSSSVPGAPLGGR